MKKSISLAIIITFVAGSAFGHTLRVPFFSDFGGRMVNGKPESGTAGFVGVKNTTPNTITMHLVYIQKDSSGTPLVQRAVSFDLDGGIALDWRPTADDPAENSGRPIPNTVSGFDGTGSILIIWRNAEGGADALKGRYLEFNSSNAFSYVLRP